ncbi:hypothetical protein PV325_004858, partial [Microctonus aethiopoides]
EPRFRNFLLESEFSESFQRLRMQRTKNLIDIGGFSYGLLLKNHRGPRSVIKLIWMNLASENCRKYEAQILALVIGLYQKTQCPLQTQILGCKTKDHATQGNEEQSTNSPIL